MIAILALALIVGLTYGAAYAEVQNVKVSGDLAVLGVARNQFDLTKGNDTNKLDDSESYFATITRVRFDADLTDNVLVTLRLINERNWNTETVANTDIDLDSKPFQYSSFFH
ncbi:MAG TPA: hypothetical protein PKI44_05800 [Candidatus Omnitrophota bacterium]|nr:hypothetical protein [Candidatus Omnitrophota bacterium]